MGLKLTISPGEKVIIGNAVIRNVGSKMEFEIENEVPVLRTKDIMTPEQVKTPCQYVYYLIQIIYLAGGIVKIDKTTTDEYWNICRDLVKASPSLTSIIDDINELILQEQHYRALKLAQQLLAYEKELLNHV